MKIQKDALLKEYVEEIKSLKASLKGKSLPTTNIFKFFKFG